MYLLKNIISKCAPLAFFAFVVAFSVTASTPAASAAEPVGGTTLPTRVIDESNSRLAASCSRTTFFGLVPWYNYLTLNDKKITDENGKVAYVCETNFNFLGNDKGSKSTVPLVLLAVIDDLLRIAGLVTIFYIITGGIKYITSQGSSDETAKAQSTITNALIGLAISLVAVGIVTFIGNTLGG